MNPPITIPRTRYVLRAPPNAPRAGIGVDPGKEGAIVIVEGEAITRAWWWATSTRRRVPGVRIWESSAAGTIDDWYPSLGRALRNVCWIPGPESIVTVEAVHGQPGKSGFEVLAEYAGRLIGWVEAEGGRVGPRPTSTTWRADMLKLPASTAAVVAEQVAVDTLLGRPTGGRSITIARPFAGPMPPDLNGHVAEAALMAMWGRGYRAQPETVTAPGKRGSR